MPDLLPAANLYLSAPTVATIDQNGVMTISFTPSNQYSPNGLAPATGAVAAYSDYDHWHIITTINGTPTPNPFAVFVVPSYTGGSLTYTQTITSGTVSLTMAAFDASSAQITNFWSTSGVNIPSPGTPRFFPTLLVTTNVIFSSTSVLLGQTLTVTLSNSGATAYSGADQWNILWPDGASTGWLPLASNVVTKSFSTPGTF